MTTFIEEFSERIDYSEFSKEECAMLNSTLPLLEKGTISSLKKAMEILEQVFDKNENDELGIFIEMIYDTLIDETQTKHTELVARCESLEKKVDLFIELLKKQDKSVAE